MNEQPSFTERTQTEQPRKNRKNLKVFIIVLSCLLVVAGVGYGVYAWQQTKVDDLQSRLDSARAEIRELTTKNTLEAERNEPTDESGQAETSTSYMELPKLGIRIPIDTQFANEFDLVEIDNGYRLDLKMISEYRKQGYCENGGSSAMGTITSQTVNLAQETNSSFFDNKVFHFSNNVIYPNKYITFGNTDAACWDLGTGGTERGEAVAKKVSELKTPLEEALKNIQWID